MSPPPPLELPLLLFLWTVPRPGLSSSFPTCCQCGAERLFCSCFQQLASLPTPPGNPPSTSTFPPSPPRSQAASALFYRIWTVSHCRFFAQARNSQNHSLLEQKGLPEEFSKCSEGQPSKLLWSAREAPREIWGPASAQAMQGQGLCLRVATLLTGLLECLGFAGVLFGWASLVYVFKAEHYFDELCEPDAGATGNFTAQPGKGRP